MHIYIDPAIVDFQVKPTERLFFNILKKLKITPRDGLCAQYAKDIFAKNPTVKTILKVDILRIIWHINVNFVGRILMGEISCIFIQANIIKVKIFMLNILLSMIIKNNCIFYASHIYCYISVLLLYTINLLSLIYLSFFLFLYKF